MERRAFIGTFAGSLLAVSLSANAQQAIKMYRIGLLKHGTEPIQKPFWDAMRDFGWIQNQNVKIEARYADSEDQLPVLAAELVRLKVDLILTQGTPATRAAKQATNTIPIVFSVGGDPVEAGLVANLARPGENLTGFAYGLYEDKILEILQAALPGISRVAYPIFGEADFAIQRAARALGVQVNGISVKGPKDFGPFYAEARRIRADAVMIQDVAWFGPHLEHIAAESAKSRLPAIGFKRTFAEAGSLLSYGPTIQAAPRVAAQVDKILKGAKPADLPVQLPTTFELVINLKTTKTLGVTIPQSVLLRANEVIQ
jgi:putative tryptophan/tyrosine transport system substrate-binding protein